MAETSHGVPEVSHLMGSLNIRADELLRHHLADHSLHVHPEIEQGIFAHYILSLPPKMLSGPHYVF